MAGRSQVDDALARERRERRNFSKRNSICNKQVQKSTDQLLQDAQQRCQELVSSAQNEAAHILENAQREAASILETSKVECAELIERRDSLRQRVGRQEVHLLRLDRRIGSSENSVPSLEVSTYATEFRARDAARKQVEYWRKRSESSSIGSKQKEPSQSTTDGVEEEHSPPNRQNRSLHTAVSWAVSQVLNRVGRFNDGAKKKFFKKFWLHPSLKVYQPVLYGSPRLDASIGAAISDLKTSLRTVKTARRKDHLAAKQVLMTALAGESIVSNRYQTCLARALGIKRQNVHTASKRRKLIDGDSSVKYPMGERKVRSDKISNEIRKIVQKFWESNTRISPCKKDRARLRLFRKVYEEHQIHWLEDTEVHGFLFHCCF